MHEPYTEQAMTVMRLANEEARRFDHEYIGTEHLLLALMKVEVGVAYVALRQLGVDLQRLRQQVERIIQPGPRPTNMDKLPQTPRTKKVIEYAIDEARTLKSTSVGTEHLLLGLIREEEGVAAQVLMTCGLTLAKVRSEFCCNASTTAGSSAAVLLGSSLAKALRIVCGQGSFCDSNAMASSDRRSAPARTSNCTRSNGSTEAAPETHPTTAKADRRIVVAKPQTSLHESVD